MVNAPPLGYTRLRLLYFNDFMIHADKAKFSVRTLIYEIYPRMHINGYLCCQWIHYIASCNMRRYKEFFKLYPHFFLFTRFAFTSYTFFPSLQQ